MKKTVILLAGALMVCAACVKENPAPVAQTGYSITAATVSSEPEAKATVDGLQVKWTTGDKIALFISDGTVEDFTLVGEGPVISGTFTNSTYAPSFGHTPNGVAAFPAEGATLSDKKVSVTIPSTFTYGTSPVPMVGVHSGVGNIYDFDIATGAIHVSYKGVPPYPSTFMIRADKNICGTLEIADFETPRTCTIADEGAAKIITVTGVPKGDAEFTIPLPAGTYSIEVALMAADGATPVPRSYKGPTSVTIEAGKIAKMKPIDLEEGSPASRTLKEKGADFDWSLFPGKWKVKGGDYIKVLGGGGGNGYPAFVSPKDKSWDWDGSVYYESDNGLVIKNISTTATQVTGTMNWWAGNDGKWWNYIWKFQKAEKPEYIPFYGTDLSGYYNKIPKGEKTFTLDLTTMKGTLSNGEKPVVLFPGTYTFAGNRDITIPDGCFALQFHLGNMKPMTSWNEKDIDRFMFCPLEYIIIFERTGDLS